MVSLLCGPQVHEERFEKLHAKKSLEQQRYTDPKCLDIFPTSSDQMVWCCVVFVSCVQMFQPYSPKIVWSCTVGPKNTRNICLHQDRLVLFCCQLFPCIKNLLSFTSRELHVAPLQFLADGNRFPWFSLQKVSGGQLIRNLCRCRRAQKSHEVQA